MSVSDNDSTANTSSSTSRRNSSNSALKCDNVAKYPDKKQIEDKLRQIREYLKITNSLMTNLKNTNDQVSNNFSMRERLFSNLGKKQRLVSTAFDEKNRIF